MEILAFPAFSNKKINPYQFLLYTHMEAREDIAEFSYKRVFLKKFDVFHIHWPDVYIQPENILAKCKRMALLSGAVIWLKLRGTKIVWTVHNLTPHNASHPELTASYMRWFLKQCDGLIFLSDASRKAFDKIYTPPRKCHLAVIPHGHYRDVYPAPPTREEAREILALPKDKKIILFFGMIKPYKNVEKLIESFKARGDEEALLVIAGNASAAMKERLHTAARNHPHVRFMIEFISDEALPVIMAASDLVVLPFKNILNSGSLILALSFNRPVVAPAIGSLTELRDLVGPEWVRLYNDDFGADVLQHHVSILKTETASQGICDLTALEWGKIGADTQEFYVRLLN